MSRLNSIAYESSLVFVEMSFELHEIFGDNFKVAQWMSTENPHLGNQIPFAMVLNGRGAKVLKFIRSKRFEYR